MNQLSLDTKLVLFAAGTFLLTYIFTFPTGWLISDEYSYLNQGLAIANGEVNLSFLDIISGELISYKRTSYPLGNAFWIALWIKVCGLKYAYLGSLASVLLSVFLIYKALIKESLFRLSILLFFVYPSLAFFSKSFMSSMPSLFATASFLFILFNKKESGMKWLWLTCIAALSFWIRETNIILLGSICLIHFIQDRRWFLHYVCGSIIGFLPRIISSYYFYDDPFHYVLAESFSFANILNNAGVYGIILLLFMPLGLAFILKYRGRYFLPLTLSTILFVLMYFLYSFNATHYSGFGKGVILMGRFMIPILPIFVISVGWYFRKMEGQNSVHEKIPKAFRIVIVSIIAIIIIGMQVMVFKEASLHKKVSNHIYSKYADKMIMYDLSRTTNIIRYINPFHGNLPYISDISNLEDDYYMKELFTKFDDAYLIQTLNSANSDKKEYTSKIDALIKNAALRYHTEEMEKIKIKPGLFLQVVKIREMGKIEAH